MHQGSAGTASYQDPLIVIHDGTLTIQRYYFPTGARRIRLTAISGVEQYAMTGWTGKWRIWGTTLVRWFNLDIGRPHKQQAFVIDLGRRVKPVLTQTTRRPSVPLWPAPGFPWQQGLGAPAGDHEPDRRPARALQRLEREVDDPIWRSRKDVVIQGKPLRLVGSQ